jgi:ribosomal protein L12E/L44/L45/RPP1/RPP2
MKPTTTKKPHSIRAKIKEVAEAALIIPTEEIYQRVEEELEKAITPEFLDKIRVEVLKKAKAAPQSAPAAPAATAGGGTPKTDPPKAG